MLINHDEVVALKLNSSGCVVVMLALVATTASLTGNSCKNSHMNTNLTAICMLINQESCAIAKMTARCALYKYIVNRCGDIAT